MLESIRSRSSGIFAWCIAGLIIITMALFGVNQYVSDGVDPTLYETGDQKISLNDYQGALQQAQRRALSQETSVDSSSIEFRRGVLSQLINRAIVNEAVVEAGYVAADETIAKAVLENSAFHVDGEFNQETYNQFIASNFGSEQRYWELLRTSLSSSQAASGLVESSLELDSNTDDIIALLSEKRSLDLVKLSAADVSKNIEVSETQVTEFYETNLNDFLAPEKVSVEYLALNAKSFESQVELTEEDVQAVYDQDKDSYKTTEYRNVRHILFSGDDAQSQAESALERIKSGSKFADLAKELSQDPGSAETGGDLGEIGRGQMVEPFENAAFDLALNTISSPISTEFGVHLIEVTGITGGEEQSYDEVKESIKQAELTRLSEVMYFDKLETLRNSVFENSDTLQVAAEDLGLVIEKSALFTRDSGDGYFNNPTIRSAAFAESVLNENQNSDVIDITPTEVLVLRKSQYVAEQAKPLEEVKDQVTTALKSKLAKESISTDLDTTYDAVLANGQWDDALKAGELSAEQVVVSYLDKEGALPFSVTSDVYSLPQATDSVSVGKSIDDQGNGYLFKLNSVEVAELGESDAQILDLVKNDVGFRNSVSVAQTYITDKVQKALAEVNQDLL